MLLSRRLPASAPARAFAFTLALCASATAPAAAAVRLQPIATADRPVFVTHAGDARLFIVELGGRIRIFDPARGGLLATTFLDLRARVSSGGEQGLLSIAFHPDFASNRFFYVNYTDVFGSTVVERYRVSATNPDLAEASSAARLLTIAQPYANHNGGQLQIGPRDGHLYVGMGDGGAGGDPSCHAQRKDTLLGKMLRLDVRANLNQAPFYGIPTDNPFITAARDPGNQIPDEIWAFGLRNPWRFSFDRATGDLYIADVGQNDREEIDLARAGAPGGANFGWKIMEGTRCFGRESCPSDAPTCGSFALSPPIHEYAHAGTECSVTGGYVYRGSQAPELLGRYLFGDFCSGQLRTLVEVGPGSFQMTSLLQGPSSLTSFGEDRAGELYLTASDTVFKITSDRPPASVPAAGPAGVLLLAFGLAALGARFARRR